MEHEHIDTLTGTFVAEDPRTEEEKARDYTPDEIIGGAVEPIVWMPRLPFDWDVWSLRNQITSFSCGGQAAAKAIEGLHGVVASALPVYRRRSNFPSGGMFQQNIGDILKNSGTTSEEIMKSQMMTEEQMNAVLLIDVKNALLRENYTISAYYFHGAQHSINMDALALSLAMGHALIFLVRTNVDEWQDIVRYKDGAITFSHFVTAVGKRNFLTIDGGEKGIIIDDSCNAYSTLKKNGSPSGQRILTESFLRERSYGIMAIVPKERIGTFIRHTFTKHLRYGTMRDTDVMALQDILKYEGYMDKSIPSTGNFLQLTAKALVAWQCANGMYDFENAPLNEVVAGPKSIALLNKLYGAL